ncbi:MAG: DNA-binding protein WhiA [Clostridiales bacterium]|nr:DNA-binding protein WhiA [Clostridiales bacterium]
MKTSFSQQVKNELLQIEYENACCQKALLYGMCLFGKSFSSMGISLQTENEGIAKLYKKLIRLYCNIRCDIKVSPKGRSYSINISEKSDCDKILGLFGHNRTGSLKIDHNNLQCDNCMHAFLAGVFLSCGTVSDPKKDYHLEFTVPYLNLSKSLVTLLSEADLSPKTSNRKGYNIVYFKGSESIEDCLYLMGASSSMFEMMNVEIVKDIRNKANRTANCETANISRIVKASSKHLLAIEKIKKEKGLDFLKPDLKEIAVLRYDNPDSSLADLAEMSGLSRSGVNHRLQRILEIAENLK